jgi:hypothetical protein
MNEHQDTTRYQSTFGTAGTTLGEAIGATVAWYQSHDETPRRAEDGARS